MQSFGGDDFDRDSGRSSDEDQDGTVEDRDEMDVGNGEGEGAPDGDDDGDNDEDNEDEDAEQEDSQYSFGDAPNQGHIKPPGASQSSSVHTSGSSGELNAAAGHPTSAPTSHPNPSVSRTSATPPEESTTVNGYEMPKMRAEVLSASVYDIVPTIAAPHSTSINCVTATPDLRWVFSGGSDGYIRKFNWIETANGKSMLTVAQRHPFVDSVTKAGVLMSYWENSEDPNGMLKTLSRMI